MVLRNKKTFIILFDILGRITFFIPLVLERISRKTCLIPEKILILELWGIGDLVMMSPILQPLRENFPQAKIILLSKQAGKDIFGQSSYFDDYIVFDFPWTKFSEKYKIWEWDWKSIINIIRQLKKEKFELILDARGDIRNNLVSYLIGGKRRLGYDWMGGGYFLTDKINFNIESSHRSEGWYKLLEHLKLKIENPKTDIPVSTEIESQSKNFLKVSGLNENDLIIGIHPGASVKVRCWSLEKFAKVAEYLKDTYKAKTVIFIDSEGYGEGINLRSEWIKAKVDLNMLIGIIKNLDLLICNDSGAMHIATAVGTPVVAVFGPGDAKTIGPYGGIHRLVQIRDLNCRPCFDRCKYDRMRCLESIRVEDVAKAADEVIADILKERITR